MNHWKDLMYERPPNDALIEVCRCDGESPRVIRLCDMSPWWNIAGVYWRLTGIQRMAEGW
jgi:hypothetical protein